MSDKYSTNEFDPNAPAWWISPEGKILAISVGETHIKKVIENPKAFGYTLERIEKIYGDCGEPMGSELEARGQIIKDILGRGWIRIRKSGFCYSFQLSDLSATAKDYIFDWAARMERWVSPSMLVNINTKMGDEGYTVAEIAGGALGKMEESEHERKTLIPITSVFDF